MNAAGHHPGCKLAQARWQGLAAMDANKCKQPGLHINGNMGQSASCETCAQSFASQGLNLHEELCTGHTALPVTRPLGKSPVIPFRIVQCGVRTVEVAPVPFRMHQAWEHDQHNLPGRPAVSPLHTTG